MTPKQKAPRSTAYLALLAVFGMCSSPVALADDYRDARARLIEAYQAGNYGEMRVAANDALLARPGFAGGLFNRALAELLDGDAEQSLATLNELLQQQVDFGVTELDEFAALRELPGWPAYAAAAAQLHEPVGEARVAFTYDDGQFIPEGIAVDAAGTAWLGSIRSGDIVRIGADTERLATAADGPHWSVFGMRQRDGVLWFVSSAIDEFAALQAADKGRNGLFAVDASTGKIRHKVLLPVSEEKQVLGDLIFADDDTLLLVDQAGGYVYRYSIAEDRLSVLVDAGVFGSPQGLVLNASGEHFYIADYLGGLFRVELATGDVQPLTATDPVNLYGVDGLYRHGNRLIAIQNGVRPNRVLALELGTDGLRIEASRILAMNLPEFDEPNLGQVVGDTFYFIANSHWNRFDADGKLPDDLAGPIVLQIDLTTPAN